MELKKLFEKRESCRSFDGRQPEASVLERAAELASLAPSAVNRQPWKMLAVTSPEKVALVADAVSEEGHNGFCASSPAFFVMLEEREFAEKQPENLNSHNCTFFDMGIVTAHLCLAAAELGLGTCILGWFNEQKIREALGVEDRYIVAMAVAAGYPADPEPRPKKRKPIEEVFEII